jgi:protein-S-isoprenylcysteine O-methyltransferase Ste14
MKLLLDALCKFTIGLILVGLLLFLPAGTLAYFGGWLFICLLFIPILILGIVLYLKAPELLQKRLNHKEKEKTQQGVVGIAALLFLFGFIAAGLDHRFGWSDLPLPTVIVAAVMLLAGYAMYAEVMRENAYLSRTVEVQEGQKVIDTGLYGVVRHPMYLATILLFISVPLVLGSWISLLFFAFYPILMVIRIRNEEQVLSEQLDGYREYMEKVKYRLIPYVW